MNVINPDKNKKTEGNTFHLFYPDLHTAILFDKDFAAPIIWGTKAEVMRILTRKIDAIMGDLPRDTTKVRVFSYIFDQINGYRRIDTYNGPIDTISKYIRHY